MKARVFLSVTLMSLSQVKAGSDWQWAFGGSLENVVWASGGQSPALLDFEDGVFFAPSLSLSLDVQPSDRWYFHASVKYDRGFDAGSHPDGELRLDEVMLRYHILEDRKMTIQVGKFPTVFGSWVSDHDFYDDPFLTAPLPYGEINGAGVFRSGQTSPLGIQGRALGLTPDIFHLEPTRWSSHIWGPAYSNGLSIFGSHGKWDYAVEIKNSDLGASPKEWGFGDGDFDSPTFSGRIGYRPDASWKFGVSLSQGPYLTEDAEPFLPLDVERSDLAHTLIGMDVRWAHHDWIISGELIHSSYETLTAGDLDSLTWYLQARWKAAPGLWVAGRISQTLNNDITAPDGSRVPWTPDLFRSEIAVGWRVTPDILLKGQYSYTQASGGLPGPSKHLFGVGFGWRF